MVSTIADILVNVSNCSATTISSTSYDVRNSDRPNKVPLVTLATTLKRKSVYVRSFKTYKLSQNKILLTSDP